MRDRERKKNTPEMDSTTGKGGEEKGLREKGQGSFVDMRTDELYGGKMGEDEISDRS